MTRTEFTRLAPFAFWDERLHTVQKPVLRCFMCCSALRIMDVRAAYCKDDFEWHMMQSLAVKDINEANVALLRKNVENSFKRSSSIQQQDAAG